MRRSALWLAWTAVLSVSFVGGLQRARGETAAITAETPWRVYLVHFSHDKRQRDAKPLYTAMPPAAWAEADFDDSGWGRYSVDLPQAVGGYGFGQSAAMAVLCMRTRFGISDPAAARDLTLSLEYRGGVAVYVNGREVARQHLPPGPLEAATPGGELPPEAFEDAAGSPLRATNRPAQENAERYEKRIRKLTVAIPADVLRRGSNALALQLHSPDGTRGLSGGKSEWSGAGLCEVKLASAAGTGVTAYADAIKGVTVWNATPMDTVGPRPGKFQAGFLWGGVTVTPVALTRGNPFDPLQPIRTVAPRGGTCSGQVVVSGPGPMDGVKAAVSPLKHVRTGAALPPDAVRVAYAKQDAGEMFCNALMPVPVDGTPVQPVWVLADIPRDQAPGWYAGELSVAAGGAETRVPVQVLVAGWTVTDPKDNATLMSLYQSPETLAEYYKAEPWSDRHFALIEKSMQCMAGMGNDVLLVPVILDNYLNHKYGLVRWVKKGNGYEPEFSAFERYLELQTRAWGRPKVVTLSVWKNDYGCRTWFRGLRSDTIKPCMVTRYDPAAKTMEPMQAPHFGEPGSEEFWRPMIDGVRRLVKARGIDDRFLLLGEPFDARPLEAHRLFFEQIAPGMRWQIYSHFDGGEPPPKDGKFVCHGGFEVGFRINPNGGCLPEFDRNWPKPAASNDYFVAQVQRVGVHLTSSPLSYRLVLRESGTLARTGLDFWPIGVDSRGRQSSYYQCPPNEGWLWRGHVPYLTAPGPDGTVRTTRGQMLLECLQETELYILLRRARENASPELAARIDRCFGGRGAANAVGTSLSQAMISMDLLGLAAREYAVAAELAGTPGDGAWASPPPAAAAGAN